MNGEFEDWSNHRFTDTSCRGILITVMSSFSFLEFHILLLYPQCRILMEDSSDNSKIGDPLFINRDLSTIRCTSSRLLGQRTILKKRAVNCYKRVLRLFPNLFHFLPKDSQLFQDNASTVALISTKEKEVPQKHWIPIRQAHVSFLSSPSSVPGG